MLSLPRLELSISGVGSNRSAIWTENVEVTFNVVNEYNLELFSYTIVRLFSNFIELMCPILFNTCTLCRLKDCSMETPSRQIARVLFVQIEAPSPSYNCFCSTNAKAREKQTETKLLLLLLFPTEFA